MKFTVPVQTILGPLVQVAGICSSGQVNPDDLSHYMFVELKQNALTFIGTDTNVQMKAVVSLPDGVCESEGAFLINAGKAQTFFKSLGANDEVALELDDSTELLHVTSNKAEFHIRVRAVTPELEFPVFNIEYKEPPQTLRIEEQKLRYMFERSVFCVSAENFRDYLRGVRIEANQNEICVFALDGHRMAAVEANLTEPCEKPVNILMTLRGVNELIKLLSNEPEKVVTFEITEDFISANIGIFTISNRLLRCSYPNVRNVLPKECTQEIAVDTEMLKTYVKRISMFSNKRLNHINMLFTNNSLALHSQNNDHEVGAAVLNVEYPDPEGRLEVNLNGDFVRDFLNAIDTKRVIFGFTTPANNTLIRPDLEGFNDLGVRIRYVVSHIMV